MKTCQSELGLKESIDHRKRVQKYHFLQWRLWGGEPLGPQEVGRIRGVTRQRINDTVAVALERARTRWENKTELVRLLRAANLK